MSGAIVIRDLGFQYPGGQGIALSGFNMTIDKGTRFGLFGPNGAGKTTLMNLMTGVLRYKRGSIELLGHEMTGHDKTVNRKFGFVPQDFSFFQELTPVENLAFFGAWYGMSNAEIKLRTKELLEVLGLTDVGDRRVVHFSGGMKRRVNMAIGVIHRPELLFLDEPTVGVDVQSRHAIITYLRKLNEQGTTLVYTSHQLEEAEALCETIAFLDNGKLIAFDRLHRLLDEHRQEGLEGLFLGLTGKQFRD